MPFKDFDAVARERNNTQIEFKFRGEMYKVNPSIPFFAKLRLAQIQSGKASTSEVTLDELFSLLNAILGADTTKRLEAAMATDEEIQEILAYVVSGQVEEIKADTAKESPKAPRGKPRSTK